MAICPADLKPCIDDLCYGSGCLALQGVPMLEPCPGCKKLIPIDGSDRDDCECEPVPWDEDGEDARTEATIEEYEATPRCSCPYCFCLARVEGGGCCPSCEVHAHQG